MLGYVNDPGEIELIGRFYYKDYLNYSQIDDVFATYIPDING